MKKNLLKTILLTVNIILLLSMILELNYHFIKINYLYGHKDIFFIKNYFYSIICIFYIYAIIGEDILKKSNQYNNKSMWKITLFTFISMVIIREYHYYIEIFLLLNFMIIIYFYRKLYLLVLVLPLLISTSLINERYLTNQYEDYYKQCQTNEVKKIKSCIDKFSVKKIHFNYYLTDINTRLAKNNHIYKEELEKTIIKQNNDDTCKINKYYVVDRKKSGEPCIG